MEFNAICPKCGEMIYADPEKTKSICPKCKASLNTRDACRAFEEAYPTKGERFKINPADYPITDFEISSDGTLDEYKGNGGEGVIPDGVNSIGDRAFSGCKSLTSVVIPSSVTSIGNGAFRFCLGLESITVETGNPEYHSKGNCIIETATKTLIVGCKTSVIPSDGSVTSIGVEAFAGCKSLTSVVIPDSVTGIEERAFYVCDSLKRVVIPDSVTSIGWSAFSGCDSLEHVVIPDSVTRIENSAFYGCDSLERVVIPGSVTSIGKWAFNYCTSLKEITFESPKGWKAEGAFFGTDFSDPARNAKLLVKSQKAFKRK